MHWEVDPIHPIADPTVEENCHLEASSTGFLSLWGETRSQARQDPHPNTSWQAVAKPASQFPLLLFSTLSHSECLQQGQSFAFCSSSNLFAPGYAGSLQNIGLGSTCSSRRIDRWCEVVVPTYLSIAVGSMPVKYFSRNSTMYVT